MNPFQLPADVESFGAGPSVAGGMGAAMIQGWARSFVERFKVANGEHPLFVISALGVGIVVSAFIVLLVEDMPGPSERCERRWRESGLSTKHDEFGGCLVMVGGRWWPEHSVRAPGNHEPGHGAGEAAEPVPPTAR